MRASLLDRTILTETTRLTVFYAVVYLALVSIALIAPLLDKGAPLWSVIQVLPGQLPFPATIVLPLALTTAIIATFGRMREDGELTALASGGISPARLPWALWPLICCLLCVVTWLAHSGMPRAYRSFTEAKSALARQAVSTKVAREDPIIDSRHSTLTALGTDGNQLTDVFVWYSQRSGDRLLCYAPTATWVTDPDAGGSAALRLQFENARPLFIEPGESGHPDLTILDFPNLVVDIPLDFSRFDEKPDGKDSVDLLIASHQIKALGQRIQQAERIDEFLPAMLIGMPDRFTVSDVRHWPHLLQDLRNPDHPLSALLDQATRAQLAGADTQALRRTILEQFNSRLDTAHELVSERPVALTEPLLDIIDTGSLNLDLQRRANNLLLRHAAPDAFAYHGLDFVIRQNAAQYGWHRSDLDRCREQVLRRNRRELVGHQMAWHLRLVLSSSILSYWLIASGLGLGLGSRNRMMAGLAGLGIVLITLLPGIAMVKGMRGRLPIHPGIILWTPQILVACCGAWLLRRAR